jgi:hypothetical protein
VKAAAGAGAREFLAMLQEQPGAWNQAKAAAFAELMASFPDPAGPPEWALRQIVRGQFDRRIPQEWRPVFVEVFHQWLGFQAESQHETDSRPSSLTWWRTSLVPALRRHGWAGSAVSPLALLLLAVVLAWSGLGAAHARRQDAVRRSDVALMRLGEVADHRIGPPENEVLESLADGSDEELLDALAKGAELRLARFMLLAERDRAIAEIEAAMDDAATWWAWPLLSSR